MPCMAMQLQALVRKTSPPAAFSPVVQPRPCLLRHRQAVRCQAASTGILSKTQKNAGTFVTFSVMFPVLQHNSCALLSLRGAGVEREEVPHYAEGAQFLKSIGIQHASEISRVLDVAMNPNSLYLKDRHKRRSVNVNVCLIMLQLQM